MKRVTADSNIYVSALIWGGKPLKLLELALQGEIELAISPDIQNETLRILHDKFHLAAEEMAKAEGFLMKAARMVTPTERLNVVQWDPDDNAILECAVAAGSDTVVSGDTDLLRLGTLRGIKIQRLSEFLAERSGRGL